MGWKETITHLTDGRFKPMPPVYNLSKSWADYWHLTTPADFKYMPTDPSDFYQATLATCKVSSRRTTSGITADTSDLVGQFANRVMITVGEFVQANFHQKEAMRQWWGQQVGGHHFMKYEGFAEPMIGIAKMLSKGNADVKVVKFLLETLKTKAEKEFGMIYIDYRRSHRRRRR
jgi:hypothetical protein